MRLFISILLLTHICYTQTIPDCKKRFDTYLNYNGSLNNTVKFNKESITIYNSKGQKEFIAHHKELVTLAEVFEHYSLDQQIAFYKRKGTKKLPKRQRDSIRIYVDHPQKFTKKETLKALTGIKIAIDAGHLAASFTEAMNEQKYLYFLRDSLKSSIDTVKLYEADLTYKTAYLLKKMLEEKGATIYLTREDPASSSFGCSYSYWYKNHKKRVLDSLLIVNKLEPAAHKKLMNLPEYNFFWDFFRDYELLNRAKLINEFKPDITLIVHYNVDEKNIPWKKTSQNNYTMAFIGGCYTAGRLEKPETKMNFLRALFTDQLNKSEKLARITVEQFHQNLNISVACTNDADYLKNNCLSLSCNGVFCRSLILCNRIQSPLVYGECLYQDNVNESKWLMDNSKKYYGIETNERVYLVAKSYYEAVIDYFWK